MIASPVTPKCLRSLDVSFAGTKRSIEVGHLLLVYLGTNGLLVESAEALGVSHQRMRRILVGLGCCVTRKRGKDQGALLQPVEIHDLAKTWADLRSDLEIVPDLLERYAEAMQIGRDRREVIKSNQTNRHANELYSTSGEQPTRFLERKQDPPWWSHIDEHN